MAEKEWRDFLANQALERLRETEKAHVIQCFELFAKGISIADIAAQLGLAENTVYVYKARVLNQLSSEVKLLRKQYG